MAGKVLLADYFLGFSTRGVSGGGRPWRLYYEGEGEAGRGRPRCSAAWAGDVYVNGDVKEIASTYYPLIGPYDVEDADVAEYHVLLAKCAGVDGFVAEFTIGQEAKLLSLVRAGRKYGLAVGVNWINQSHLSENEWKDRAEAMGKAREVVRWLAKEVYGEGGGVRVGGRPVVLTFLAHPREATGLEPFFSPGEVRELKVEMARAGVAAEFYVLPWERLGEDRGEGRVWDGYFPWVWSSSGRSVEAGKCWDRETTCAQYIERLESYYEMAERVKGEGRIGGYVGAVCPGFDDHRGLAWGEGLRRHLRREGGRTLAETWRALRASKAEAALLVTWNDWVESSQVEPSLELGYSELVACAREAAGWKGVSIDERLVGLPERVFRGRRSVELLRRSGAQDHARLGRVLDLAAGAVGRLEYEEAERALKGVEGGIEAARRGLVAEGLHVFWEYGFDSCGLALVGEEGKAERVWVGEFAGVKLWAGNCEVGFAVEGLARGTVSGGAVVARVCFEYLDVGGDFVEVLVDAEEESKRVIASFKKGNTGGWRTASVELVNARFARGLGGADLVIRQRADASGGVRYVRIDGVVWRDGRGEEMAGGR